MPRIFANTSWFARPLLRNEPDSSLSLTPAGVTAVATAWFPAPRLRALIEAVLPELEVVELMGLCCAGARPGALTVTTTGVARFGFDGVARRFALSAVVEPTVDVPHPGVLRVAVSVDPSKLATDCAVTVWPASHAEPLSPSELEQLSQRATATLRTAAAEHLATPTEIHRSAGRYLGEAVAAAAVDVDVHGNVGVTLSMLDSVDVPGTQLLAQLRTQLAAGPVHRSGELVFRLAGARTLHIKGTAKLASEQLLEHDDAAVVQATFDIDVVIDPPLADSRPTPESPPTRLRFQALASTPLAVDGQGRPCLGLATLEPPQALVLVGQPAALDDRELARILDALPEHIWAAVRPGPITPSIPAWDSSTVALSLTSKHSTAPVGRHHRRPVHSPAIAREVDAPRGARQWQLRLSPAFVVALLRQLIDHDLQRGEISSQVAVFAGPDHLAVEEHGEAFDRRASLKIEREPMGSRLWLEHDGAQARIALLSPEQFEDGLGALTGRTPVLRIDHGRGIESVLVTTAVDLDNGALRLAGHIRPWIGSSSLARAVHRFELGPQRAVARVRGAGSQPWAFRLGCGAFVAAMPLFARLERDDELLYYHVSRSSKGTPYLRGNPNSVELDNVEVMNWVSLVPNPQPELVESGLESLRALGKLLGGAPTRLVWDADAPELERWPAPSQHDRYPDSYDWSEGPRCLGPHATAGEQRRVLFNPAVARADAKGIARHGHDDGGERQEYLLADGRMTWRRDPAASFAPIRPTRAFLGHAPAPMAVTYARRRAGEVMAPPAFELLATGGARVFAKQKDHFRFFFATVAPEFLHATPYVASCNEDSQASPLSLPQSTADRVVAGAFATLDPQYNRHLDERGQPRFDDDWSGMFWPTLAASNGHPSASPFTIPVIDPKVANGMLEPLINEALDLLFGALARAAPTAAAFFPPLFLPVLLGMIVGAISKESIRGELHDLRKKLIAAIAELGGQSLARTTKQLGLAADVMIVEVEPGVWYHVDPRPIYDDSRRSEPPAFVRWQALVAYERLDEPERALVQKQQHGVLAERVLDIGVGHVYRHLAWDESNGGEFDTMDTLGRVWYPTLLGAAEDGGGYIDGTTNFYVLAEIQICDDEELEELERERQASQGFSVDKLLAVIRGERDREQRAKDTRILTRIAEVQANAVADGRCRRSYAILWIDEQTYASDRFHILHPSDAYWRFGKDWTLIGQATSYIKRTLAAEGDDWQEKIRVLLTKHPILGLFVQSDLREDAQLQLGGFWCPFASDWFDRKPCVSASSRMLVSRQVILLTGNHPDDPSRPLLFSINASYGTLDRSWRWRAYPTDAAVLPGLAWADIPPEQADACLPMALRFRDDGTIVLPGRSRGVDGYWYQRYLPADNMEVPGRLEIEGRIEAGARPRIPITGYPHAWNFLPREVEGRDLYLDYDRNLLFGVPSRVDSRSQLYPIRAISHGTIDATQLELMLREGSQQWEDAEGALFWPAGSKLAPPRKRRSPYNNRLRFYLSTRGHWGPVALFADKRDDELPVLTTTLPAEGKSPRPPGRVRLRSGDAQLTADFGARVRRWSLPVVQAVELAVDDRRTRVTVRFYTRMAGRDRQQRARTIPWWRDSLDAVGFDLDHYMPPNLALTELDPELVARMRARVGAGVEAIHPSQRDPVFPDIDSEARDLPDIFICRVHVGRVDGETPLFSHTIGDVGDGGPTFSFRRYAHFLYVGEFADVTVAARIADEIAAGSHTLRIWFEDVTGHLACAEHSELRIESLG